ncbi:MAG TPA: hypothetical protein VGR01_03995 [Burkholderiales bacterium]|jgi:hypothetical protein|nr:hypothetical protein [Burkholderiales bacterium]
MNQKIRVLPLLTIAAAASVVAFSSIGIAAITGHLPIARSSLNPFSAFGGAVAVPTSASDRAPSSLTHEGLTRRAGETAAQGKPVNFRPGARLPARKSSCPNCGVVDSIKPQQASGDDGKLTAALGTTGRAYQINREELSSFSFVVIVRMENGTLRTIHENQRPPFSIGERVKLVNGTVIPLG